MRRGLFVGVFLLLAAGCEPALLGAARREDSIEAYRRYLASRPVGPPAAEARERLETLEYRRARAADLPIGYRQYLQDYPRGRFITACRQQLARLALAQATTAADLERTIELHPRTPEAAQARTRLPALRAKEALTLGTEAALQAFLDQFADAEQAGEVRKALARLRYANLASGRAAREAFAREFAGTPEALAASEQARTLLADDIRLYGSQDLLKEYIGRYPGNKDIAHLEQIVARRRLQQALASLDLETLALLGNERTDGVSVETLLAPCRKAPSTCRELALRVRQAGPYHPRESLGELRTLIYGPEADQAWQAIDTLGWMVGEGAGNQLLELVGSERLSTLRLALPALRRWLGRQPPVMAKHWLARKLTLTETVNPDQQQRRGCLLLLDGQDAAGRALLEELTESPDRRLPAAFLLVRWDLLASRPPLRGHLASLTTGLKARLARLLEAFPEEITDESRAAAALAERELTILEQELEALAALAEAPVVLTQMRSEAAHQLARWRSRLAGQGAPPTSAPAPDLAESVRQHEARRLPALKALLSGRDPLGRASARAICTLFPVAGCPAQPRP